MSKLTTVSKKQSVIRPNSSSNAGSENMSTIKTPITKTNPLGDKTAENDLKMLNDAFVETADFRTLLESDDRTVVVGRRGTGKSALFLQLRQHWEKDKRIITLSFSPEDSDIIGFRSILRPFAESFILARAATKLLWRYSIMMEMANSIASNYKLRTHIERDELLIDHLKRWNEAKGNIINKCRSVAKKYLSSENPEEAIGDLPLNLDLTAIEDRVTRLFSKADRRVVILMDRLDEGYESDTIGIGIIAGLAYAAIELNQKSELFRPIIFLRDNIYRSLTSEDPDYSRNIEGQVIRLHWDWAQLLQLAATRMKVSFNLDMEKGQRVWDRCTAGELQGREGFKKCLQFTLYRPRDLLSLLNEAFFCAFRHDRSTAIINDLEYAAKSISVARLEDLFKEYQKIFPSIQPIISSFKNNEPELTTYTALNNIEQAIIAIENDGNQAALTEARLLQPAGLLQSLYSIGFIGIHDNNTSSFSFCHDGRTPDKGFENSDTILIHPCYWLGLNLNRNALEPDEAEEINDEYDIKVESENPKIRNSRIGQIVSRLEKIPMGREGDREFEAWCLEALRIIFAAHLTNLEPHPNGAAVQRRDITGSNSEKSEFWARVYKDYRVRHVVFDAKNYVELGPTEYRQLQSYLTGGYGKLGFIINRDQDENLIAGKDLDWTKEMHQSHGVLIIKLPGKFLCKLLQKLRSPEKHDAIDQQMWTLLNKYELNYLNIKSSNTRKKPRG